MECEGSVDVESFGPFEICEGLGHGRRTSVVRAIETESGRVVALKRLHRQHASDAASIRRFVREARLAQSLNHPNIVRVFGIGNIDGIHYMSMEWIEGQDLAALMKSPLASSRMPVGVAIWILRKVLAALDYAMAGLDDSERPLGIVHRDICPSNVLITLEGEVKVIDFGIAKSLAGRYATNSGVVKGNLGYMAPEALAGRAVESRSDLYSAAVLAWELLTNRRLFGGSATEQLAKRGSFQFVAPSRLGFGISQEIDDLLKVALATDPCARWPSAAAMAGALDIIIQRYGRASGPGAWQSFCGRVGVESDEEGDGELSECTERSDVGVMRTLPAPTREPKCRPRRRSSQPHPDSGRYRFGPNPSTALDPVFDADERHRLLAGDEDS